MAKLNQRTLAPVSPAKKVNARPATRQNTRDQNNSPNTKPLSEAPGTGGNNDDSASSDDNEDEEDDQNQSVEGADLDDEPDLGDEDHADTHSQDDSEVDQETGRSTSVTTVVNYAAELKKIINNIVVLDDRAGVILELFEDNSVQDVAHHIRDDGPDAKDMKDYTVAYGLAREAFAHTAYIDLDRIKAIAKSQERSYREASLVCVKANLVTFLVGLTGHDIQLERKEEAESLEELCSSSFPDDFIVVSEEDPPLAIYRDATFRKLTERLALELCTQSFIATCVGQENPDSDADDDEEAEQPEFDAAELLKALFLDEDDQSQPRNLSLDRFLPLTKEQSDGRILQRYLKLESLRRRGTNALREAFPWADAQDLGRKWALTYVQALDKRIEASGNAKNIKQLLKNHVVQYEPSESQTRQPLANVTESQLGKFSSLGVEANSQGETMTAGSPLNFPLSPRLGSEARDALIAPFTQPRPSRDRADVIPETPRGDRAQSPATQVNSTLR